MRRYDNHAHAHTTDEKIKYPLYPLRGWFVHIITIKKRDFYRKKEIKKKDTNKTKTEKQPDKKKQVQRRRKGMGEITSDFLLGILFAVFVLAVHKHLQHVVVLKQEE